MSSLKQLLLFVFFLANCQSVTYDELGDIDFQCVKELDYEISHLSNSDANKVSELSFLFVTYRHGIRHGERDVNDYFQSKNISFECNEKQLWGSNIRSTSYRDDRPRSPGHRHSKSQSSPSKYILELDHIDNEQIYSNTNCQFTQIADNTPNEMILSGQIVANRYFQSYRHNKPGKHNKPIHSYSTDQFKSKYRSNKYISSKALDINRVISSHVYFMEGLLLNSNDYGYNNILSIEHHDLEKDPFRADRGASTICPDTDGNDEFSQFKDLYDEKSNTDTVRNEFVNNQQSLDIRNNFEEEGGIWINEFTPDDIAFSYCADINIPLSINAFLDIMEFGKNLTSLYDESNQQFELNRCYYHQVMRAAYGRIKEALLEAIKGDKDSKKIYVYASQGNGLLAFLFGLDLFENRFAVKQGEIITWEVYKGVDYGDYSNDGDDEYDGYYFRWTRDGEFLEYPPCKDIYDSDETELCPLSVFMNNEFGFSDAVSVEGFKNVCINAVTDCWCGLCDDE